MKVLKPDEIPAESANSPLFTGGPVTRQPLLTSSAWEMSCTFRRKRNIGMEPRLIPHSPTLL